MIVVLAGVSGSGKTSVGRALAQTLSAAFVDADDLHSDASIARMRSGLPLDEEHRAPWLDRCARVLRTWSETGVPGVLACSALRHRYRDRLRAAAPALRFVLLDPPREVVEARLQARVHAFMPTALIDDQYAVLERPRPDENVLVVDDDASPNEIAARLSTLLS